MVTLNKIFLPQKDLPVFVRGTCIEEVLWLLGFNREKYISIPNEVYAFPIYDGFSQAGIKPIKPIPEHFSPEYMRLHALSASGSDGRSSLWLTGEEYNENLINMERNWEMGRGCLIYLNRKVLKTGYGQDTDLEDRLHTFRSAKLKIEHLVRRFIHSVEPLTPYAATLLNANLPSYLPFQEPTFLSYDEFAEACESANSFSECRFPD